MNDIVEIVLGVIAGVGGISGIILAGIKLSANTIAKRLEEKYTLKLNKELERYKSNLDNKIVADFMSCHQTALMSCL